MAKKEAIREPGQPGIPMSAEQLQQYIADTRRSDKRTSFVSEKKATKKQKSQLQNS